MADSREQRAEGRGQRAEGRWRIPDYSLSAIRYRLSAVGYPLLAGWAVVLLAALLYLATLDTGLRPDELRGGDLITHQYAQVQARPSNAPGYPLYTMGGWFWFRLTRFLLGWALNPVQRLASYSTLWALLSLFVLYRLILRTTQGNWPLASLSTAFYAVTYFFWFYSVTTEQYTLAVFQTLLIVWLSFRWDKGETQEAGNNRYLMWLALVVGACVANLVTTLFIAPPLLWFILSRRPGLLRQPRLIAQSVGLALLPVASYAYVYAQGAVHPEWRGEGQWPSAWAWFVDFLTTQQGRDELAPGLTLARFFTDEFPSLIWGELTWVVLIGGLVGLWWLGRRRAIFVYGTLAIYLVFCWVDRFGNWFQVIMPAYPLVVLGFATGLSVIWPGSRERGAESRGAEEQRTPLPDSLITGLILTGLVILVAYRFAVSLPRADQSYRLEDTGLDAGWAVLADQPLAYSVVVGEHDEWLALQYLTTIWGVEPPLYPRPLCQPGLPGPTNGTEQPQAVSAVYLTRRAAADPTCLADQHRYAAGATLIRVQAIPDTQMPQSARPAAFKFGSELSLVGFEVQRPPDRGSPAKFGRVARRAAHPGVRWHLSLYWQANATMDMNYTISVRPLRGGESILGDDGQPLIQDHQPVWNAYPTSHWAPGEVVRDDYILFVPDQISPDGAQIIVYRSTQNGFKNLGEARLTLEP